MIVDVKYRPLASGSHEKLTCFRDDLPEGDDGSHRAVGQPRLPLPGREGLLRLQLQTILQNKPGQPACQCHWVWFYWVVYLVISFLLQGVAEERHLSLWAQGVFKGSGSDPGWAIAVYFDRCVNPSFTSINVYF